MSVSNIIEQLFKLILLSSSSSFFFLMLLLPHVIMFKHSHIISFYISSSFSHSLTTTGPLLSSLFHESCTLWLRNIRLLPFCGGVTLLSILRVVLLKRFDNNDCIFSWSSEVMLNKDDDNLWYGIWGFGMPEVFLLDWTAIGISDVAGVEACGRLGVDNVDG